MESTKVVLKRSICLPTNGRKSTVNAGATGTVFARETRNGREFVRVFWHGTNNAGLVPAEYVEVIA